MDCNEFAPFFLLYNGGKLNGYGFATFGNLNNDRVEHPPQRAIRVRQMHTLLANKDIPKLNKCQDLNVGRLNINLGINKKIPIF